MELVIIKKSFPFGHVLFTRYNFELIFHYITLVDDNILYNYVVVRGEIMTNNNMFIATYFVGHNRQATFCNIRESQ